METSGKASAGLSSSSVGGSANISLGLSLSGSAGASASASAGGGAHGQASASSEGKRLTLPVDVGFHKQSYDVLGTAVLGPQIEVKGSGGGGGGSFAASDVSGGSAAAGASVSASAGVDPAVGSVKPKSKGFSLPGFGKKKSYPVTGEGGHGELSASGAVSPPSIGTSGSASVSLPQGELSASAGVEPSKAKKQKTSIFGLKGKKSPEVSGSASAEAAIEVPHADFPEKNGRAEVGAGIRGGAELHGASGVGISAPQAPGTLSGRVEGGLSSPSGTAEVDMEVDAHGKKPRVGGKVSLGEQSRAFALRITSPFTKLGAKFGVAETVPPSGKGAASGAGGSAGFSAGAGVGLSAGGKRRGSRSSSSSSSSSSDDGNGKAKAILKIDPRCWSVNVDL